MSVKDYRVDPDLNTAISGINIAEGCPPSGINNAIRQLMADVKAYADDVDSREALPEQSGHSGKYLTTNGTAASWVRPAARTISASAPGEASAADGDIWIQYLA